MAPISSLVGGWPQRLPSAAQARGRLIESQERGGKAKKGPVQVTPFREGPSSVTGGIPCQGKANCFLKSRRVAVLGAARQTTRRYFADVAGGPARETRRDSANARARLTPAGGKRARAFACSGAREHTFSFKHLEDSLNQCTCTQPATGARAAPRACHFHPNTQTCYDWAWAVHL